MTTATRDIRHTVLLGGMCVIGSVAMPVVPALGLSLIGASLTRLRFAAGATTTMFVAAACVGLAAVFGVVDLVLVLAGVLLALVLARQMASMSPGLAVLEATVVVALALLGAQALDAWAAGTTIVEQARAMAEASASIALPLVSSALGGAGDVELAQLTEFFFRIWPADYALNAVVSGVMLVLAIGWAGRVSGSEIRRLPRLGRTDLDARLLGLPVLAVGLLVMGRTRGAWSPAEVVGLNVLLAVRPLFAWQGLGVVADRLDRVGARGMARFVGYVFAIVGELMFFAISVLGVIDMQFNFRRLSRGGDHTGLKPGDVESGM